MLGVFQEGDELSAIVGPYDEGSGGVYARVGQNDVVRIVVAKADGPMGLYAVAQVLVGADESLKEIHPLHMMETIVIEDRA